MTRLGFNISLWGAGAGRHNSTHKRYCYGLFLDQRFLKVGGSLDLSHKGPKRKAANSHPIFSSSTWLLVGHRENAGIPVAVHEGACG